MMFVHAFDPSIVFRGHNSKLTRLFEQKVNRLLPDWWHFAIADQRPSDPARRAFSLGTLGQATVRRTSVETVVPLNWQTRLRDTLRDLAEDRAKDFNVRLVYGRGDVEFDRFGTNFTDSGLLDVREFVVLPDRVAATFFMHYLVEQRERQFNAISDYRIAHAVARNAERAMMGGTRREDQEYARVQPNSEWWIPYQTLTGEIRAVICERDHGGDLRRARVRVFRNLTEFQSAAVTAGLTLLQQEHTDANHP